MLDFRVLTAVGRDVCHRDDGGVSAYFGESDGPDWGWAGRWVVVVVDRAMPRAAQGQIRETLSML